MNVESPTFESRKRAPRRRAIGMDCAITSKMKARWQSAGPAFIGSSDIGPPSFVIMNIGCKINLILRMGYENSDVLCMRVSIEASLGPLDQRSNKLYAQPDMSLND